MGGGGTVCLLCVEGQAGHNDGCAQGSNSGRRGPPADSAGLREEGRTTGVGGWRGAILG